MFAKRKQGKERRLRVQEGKTVPTCGYILMGFQKARICSAVLGLRMPGMYIGDVEKVKQE